MQMRKLQQGFTLIELAVSFALMTIAIVGSISMVEYSRRVDQGRAVGKYMLTLNAALIEYKTQFKDKLIAMPLECGQPTYGVGGAKAAPSIGVFPAGNPLAGRSLCTLSVARAEQGNYIVNNGMQPSYTDLVALGMLSAGNSGNLVLTADNSRSVASSAYASGTKVYGFLLQRECKADNCNPLTGPFNLESWVFNIQPYRIEQGLFGSGARIGAALAAMEGQGYLSAVGGDGTLRNLLNQHFTNNPVREANGNGAVGILAAYDGWGLGNERFTYRDGTRPPTSDWDFNNKNLYSVNAFTGNSATISGNIEAGGNISAKSNITATGNITSGESVTVGKNLSVNGENSAFNHMNLKKAVTLGAECNTETHSFALQDINHSVILLCDKGTWSNFVVTKGPKTFRYLHLWTGPLGSSTYIVIRVLYNYQGQSYSPSQRLIGNGSVAKFTVPGDASDIRFQAFYETNTNFITNSGTLTLYFEDVVSNASYDAKGGCYAGLWWGEWDRRCY